MGTIDADGDAELANEPVKFSWEQIVAMQKESAALRAQAAAVLTALPAGPTPRARRLPPRNEYPLFVPTLGNSVQEDSFKGRLMEYRYGSNSTKPEIELADSATAPNKSVQLLSDALRHAHSNRSSYNPSVALSPETLQLNEVTPKSTRSGRSDAASLPVTPAGLLRHMILQERQQALNFGETSRRIAPRPTRQAMEVGKLGSGNRARTARATRRGSASPTDVTLWKACSGGLSMVAPFADGFGLDSSAQLNRRPEVNYSTNQPKAQQQAGLFGFLNWGVKMTNEGNVTSVGRKTASERDASKDLENTMKNLQKQLEQTDKQRQTEVRKLQVALQSMNQKLDHLQAHCRNLELELQICKQTKISRRNSQEYDVDEDDGISESSSLKISSEPTRQRFGVPHSSLIPELFIRTYDEVVLSMRKLSRAICYHIREMGASSSQVITKVLENHSVGKGRLRKAQKILFFESLLNQILFESFENVNFEPSGGAPVLDPIILQHVSFQAFKELQIVTWLDIEERLDKQNVIVNHNFHQFFVVRMEIVLHQLGEVGETNMPGSVISAFFDAIKAVWLLHHLAFAFRPAATILRVSQGAKFEAEYMKQVHESDGERRGTSVFLMINPGFLLDDCVVKCRVYCSSK